MSKTFHFGSLNSTPRR